MFHLFNSGHIRETQAAFIVTKSAGIYADQKSSFLLSKLLIDSCSFERHCHSSHLLAVAIIISLIIGKTDKHKNTNCLLIELPEYKSPNAHTIAIYVWEKVKDYLTKAGTTIFIASIILWIVLNFGLHGMTTNVSESFAAMIGRVAAPLLVPVGLGFWQIVVALIAGISAKEVVVSSFSVLFGIANINSPEGSAAFASQLGMMGFGSLNAYALMVFCLLYIPCLATLATIRKETNSWKWMFFSVIFQLGVAWIVTFIIYQLGSLFLG